MLGVSRKAFVLGAPRHAAGWLAAAFFFSFVPANARRPVFFSDFYICRPDASGRLFCINENPAIVAGFKRGFADEQN